MTRRREPRIRTIPPAPKPWEAGWRTGDHNRALVSEQRLKELRAHWSDPDTREREAVVDG